MVGWDRIALTKIQKFLGWNTLFYKLLLVKIVKKLVGSSIQILNSRSESRSSTQIPTLQYIVSHTVYILCSALGPQFLFLSSQGYKSWPSYLTEYNFPGGLFSISDKTLSCSLVWWNQSLWFACSLALALLLLQYIQYAKISFGSSHLTFCYPFSIIYCNFLLLVLSSNFLFLVLSSTVTFCSRSSYLTFAPGPLI